jgi:hypothetical protein
MNGTVNEGGLFVTCLEVLILHGGSHGAGGASAELTGAGNIAISAGKRVLRDRLGERGR